MENYEKTSKVFLKTLFDRHYHCYRAEFRLPEKISAKPAKICASDCRRKYFSYFRLYHSRRLCPPFDLEPPKSLISLTLTKIDLYRVKCSHLILFRRNCFRTMRNGRWNECHRSWSRFRFSVIGKHLNCSDICTFEIFMTVKFYWTSRAVWKNSTIRLTTRVIHLNQSTRRDPASL